MVKQYRKKPVVISAIKWDGDNIAEVLRFSSDCYIVNANNLKLHTLEGVMNASIGDYIIKGVKGEVYACKPDVFDMTYEPAVE
jgi:hypothetical protein